MRHLHILILLSAFVLGVLFNPEVLKATEYYIAPNGNNTTGNGTITSPWATIQKACDFVAAGDIIYLRGGVYNRRDYIDANVDGTSANPIIIMNYNGEEVVFDGTGVSLGDNAGLIYFANWDSNPIMEYYVLDGITVRNSSERGISFYKTDYLTIKNCKVYNIERRAIGGYGHYVTIENNEIFNAVLENVNGAMGSSGWAMTCYTTTDYENGAPSQNIIIRNNYIHNCWGEGIGPGQGSDNVLIEGNTVRDVWSVGIYADKATNTNIRNNHVYNTDPTYYRNGAPAVGISMANEISFGSIYSPVSNFYIYNNLISNVRKGVGFWFDDSNNEAANSYNNLVIAYNVIYQPTSQGIAIDEIPSGYTQPTGCILKNNIVYQGSSQSTVGDLTAWSISNNDWVGGVPSFGSASDFNGIPGFVNPGISSLPVDFKLNAASSPCYKTGTPVTAITTEDFWHSIRSTSAPSVGIHEAVFSVAPQYYVDASVSVSGNGLSWATAFKTIQQAANLNLQPGDVVNIKPGTYPEAVNIKSNGAQILGVTANVSVSEGNKISFPAGTNLSGVDLVNHPGEYYAYVYRSWKSNNGYFKIIEVDDAADYVVVEDAQFYDEAGAAGDLNHLSVSIGRPVIYRKFSVNPETERVVLNCATVPSAYTILYIGNSINDYDAYPASYNIIDGLDVTNSEGGIHLQSSSFNVLANGRSYLTTLGTGCLMNGNETRPATYNFLINYRIYDVHSEGVYIGAGGHPQFNNHTHYNHIIDNEIYVSGTTLLIENAIDLKEFNKGNVVEGNFIHDIKLASGGNGIIDIRDHEDNALVYGNVFKNILKGVTSTNYIIDIYGQNNNVSFFNNIIYNSTPATDGVYALRVDGGSNLNCLIANNTFYNIHKGFLLEHYSGTCTTTIANNIMQAGSTTLIEEWGNENKFTMTHNLYSSNLSQYATEPGRQVGNPYFANAAAGDFHLTDQSTLAINNGIVTNPVIAYDFDVIPRTGNPDIGAFEKGTSTPQPMVYVSSTCTQNTANIDPGATNQMIIGIQIVTSGNVNPLMVNSFTLNATGTTNQADISNAKLFYTGNSAVFAATTQFGSAFATPTSSDFTITGNQQLNEYTNYFWLTYDIAAGATIGNLADALCSVISIGSQTFVPTITSPAGGTQIGTIANMAYVNSFAVQITDEVNVGTVQASVLKIVVNTSGNANPLNVTQIRVNATGTTNFADIANARIFYTGNSDVFSDGNQFGAVKTAPTSTNFVMTENQPLLEGANYFWLTYDVKETAIVGNKIDGQLRLVWINGVSKTPTTQNPAGNRTIVDNTPEPDMELASLALSQITGTVFPASVNNEILHLTVETIGTANPLAITGINLSGAGSTTVTDIDGVKIFFTGASTTFATSSQFGNTLSLSDLQPATITGNQVLSEGLNHFWIAFDINANAANGNLIDAECYSVDLSGTTYSFATPSPAGSREVLVPLAENTVQFGFATTTTYKFGPMYRSRADSDYDYSRFSYLYTQSELAASGILPGSLITKIAWYKTNTANITNNGNAYFDIYMKNSDKTTLINPTSWETGVVNDALLVAYRTFTKTEDPFALAGWVEFVLDQPFVYSGGALEISTDWDISGVTNYPTNGGFNFRWSEAGPGKTLAAAHDYLGGISSLIFLEPYNYYYGDADGSKRPNIKITYSGGGGMDGGKQGLTNLAYNQHESASGNVKVYGFDEFITIEFLELPEENLTATVYDIEGKTMVSIPLKDLKTEISVNNISGLVIVKIQGAHYYKTTKVLLK